MDTLEEVALAAGVKQGSQMSRFLLWVGNEVYEGREPANLAILIAQASVLVKSFLAQDLDPSLSGKVSGQ